MSDAQALRRDLEQRKGRKAQLDEDLKQTALDLRQASRDLKKHQEAREVIKMVALRTQEHLQYHISETVTGALRAVFPDPYEFVVEFVERRGRTECDLLFKRGDMSVDPLTAAGGGAVDVAAFALRVAAWSMMRPRSRALLILDEPFRYLSADLLPRAGEMLQEVASRLGLQVLLVTHAEELVAGADKVFEVRKARRTSVVST